MYVLVLRVVKVAAAMALLKEADNWDREFEARAQVGSVLSACMLVCMSPPFKNET